MQKATGTSPGIDEPSVNSDTMEITRILTFCSHQIASPLFIHVRLLNLRLPAQGTILVVLTDIALRQLPGPLQSLRGHVFVFLAVHLQVESIFWKRFQFSFSKIYFFEGGFIYLRIPWNRLTFPWDSIHVPPSLLPAASLWVLRRC